MSDVSALAQEYESTAELAKRLSAALLVVKRSALRLPGAEKLSREEIETSRAVIERFVRAIAEHLAALAEKSQPPVAVDAMRLPPSLVHRLASDKMGQLEYYVQDLRDVAERLRQPAPRAQLADKDVRVIEGLASAADAETSRVFRQMMRR